MSTIAVILTCLEDVTHLEREGLRSDSLVLLAIHPAVVEHLQDTGRAVVDLSALITQADVASCWAIAQQLGPALDQLDATVAPAVQQILNLGPLPLFRSLYGYAGKHDLVGLAKLRLALGRALDGLQLLRVISYDTALRSFMPHLSILRTAVDEYGRSRRLDVEYRSSPPRAEDSGRSAWSGLRSGLRLSRVVFDRLESLINDRLDQWRSTDETRPILIVEPLYQLSFLRESLRTSERRVWKFGESLDLRGAQPPSNRAWAQVDRVLREAVGRSHEASSSTEPSEVAQVANATLEDLRTRAVALLGPVANLCSAPAEFRPRLAIWGLSPVAAPATLVMQQMMKDGLPVIGMQHGASYGIQDCQWTHFDSDFHHCTHFLSYGFTLEDVTRLYPGRHIPCSIEPVGMTQAPASAPAHKSPGSLDLLYIPAIGVSFLHENTARLQAHQLAAVQRALCLALDSSSTLRSAIKLYPGSNPSMECTPGLLRSLKNVQVLRTVGLMAALADLGPRAVLLDLPSTPLYEVLDRDIDIFLLLDPSAPFDGEALELLRRRVHTYTDVESLCSDLERWSAGELPRLRDPAFHDRHVRQHGGRSRILATVRSLAGS